MSNKILKWPVTGFAFAAVFFDVEMPQGTKMTVQDLAYTSPIWYTH